MGYLQGHTIEIQSSCGQNYMYAETLPFNTNIPYTCIWKYTQENHANIVLNVNYAVKQHPHSSWKSDMW